MFRAVWNIVKFIGEHPLARRHRARSLIGIARWQIVSRLAPGPVIVPFTSKAKLLVERGMTGATGNIYSGLHEFEDMSFLLHFLRPEDLFADVGANVGSYTILAAANVGARAISFEPVPSTQEWLRLNIALNGAEALVERRMQALGAEAGTIRFTRDHGTVNRVAGASRDGSEGAVIDVEITTLDAALAGRCPALIKIDVEGYETAAIAGAEKTLALPGLKAIIMEFNGQGKDFGYDEASLRAKMRGFGFEECTYSPFDRKLVAADLAKADNVILVRDRAFVEARLASAPAFEALGEKI